MNPQPKTMELPAERLRLYREDFAFDTERDASAARALLGHIASLNERLTDYDQLLVDRNAAIGELSGLNARIATLQTELAEVRGKEKEASAEAAAALQFLRAELGWENFRLDMSVPGGGLLPTPEAVSHSERNAHKLAAYLATTGHGIAALKRLQAIDYLLSLRTEVVFHPNGNGKVSFIPDVAKLDVYSGGCAGLFEGDTLLEAIEAAMQAGAEAAPR